MVVKPKELLQLDQRSGHKTLALTDINNTSASLDFVRMSDKFNVRPVLGIDFRNGAEQKFVGLAKNNKGFRELNDLLSRHSHEKTPFETKPDTAARALGASLRPRAESDNDFLF